MDYQKKPNDSNITLRIIFTQFCIHVNLKVVGFLNDFRFYSNGVDSHYCARSSSPLTLVLSVNW